MTDLPKCSTLDEIENWIEQNGATLWNVAYPTRPMPPDFEFRKVKLRASFTLGLNNRGWDGYLEFSIPEEIGRPNLFFIGTGIKVTSISMAHMMESGGDGFSRHRLHVHLPADKFEIMAVRQALSA